MTTTFSTSGTSTYKLPVPTAHITVNKSRKKVHEGSLVYLDNGTEFEIELHNPTSKTVAAEICLNGKPISLRKVVLRPAERMFLERYIDTPKKFLYETYLVDDTAESAKAIKDNGAISVKFYDEYVHNYYGMSNYYSRDFGYFGNDVIYGSSVGMDGLGNFPAPTPTSSSSSIPKKFLRSTSKETGRVEQGNESNQSFSEVSKKFNAYASTIVNFKLLPTSEQPVTIEEVTKKAKSYEVYMKFPNGMLIESEGDGRISIDKEGDMVVIKNNKGLRISFPTKVWNDMQQV